jgi:hypothetical protein
MKTPIISAFCGTGKTYICDKTNIKAIEVEYWKYKEKGLQNEYIKDIKKYFGVVRYIFISTDPEGLRLLEKEGYNVILVYPENELREEYLDRYIRRDSPYDFIGTIMKFWNLWLNELKDIKYCKHITLKSGEYLCDILSDNMKTLETYNEE